MLSLIGASVACSKKAADPPPPGPAATEAASVAARAATSASPPPERATVTGSAAPSAGLAAVPEGLARDCKKICAHSDELKCAHATECLPNCIAAAAVTPCASEFRALYACLVPQPLQNWQCDEDGVAAIRDGFCEAEQKASFECMQQKMVK